MRPPNTGYMDCTPLQHKDCTGCMLPPAAAARSSSAKRCCRPLRTDCRGCMRPPNTGCTDCMHRTDCTGCMRLPHKDCRDCMRRRPPPNTGCRDCKRRTDCTGCRPPPNTGCRDCMRRTDCMGCRPPPNTGCRDCRHRTDCMGCMPLPHTGCTDCMPPPHTGCRDCMTRSPDPRRRCRYRRQLRRLWRRRMQAEPLRPWTAVYCLSVSSNSLPDGSLIVCIQSRRPNFFADSVRMSSSKLTISPYAWFQMTSLNCEKKAPFCACRRPQRNRQTLPCIKADEPAGNRSECV